MLQFLFLVIAALGLLAALGTVLARNLVHAALFLVAFFFTVACQFVLLEAEFLAALQVLVYIGAVAIILMFGIMLTRNIQGDDTTILTGVSRLPAIFAGLCVFGDPGVRDQQRGGSGRPEPLVGLRTSGLRSRRTPARARQPPPAVRPSTTWRRPSATS